MLESLLIVTVGLLLLTVVVLQILALLKKPTKSEEVQYLLQALAQSLERLEKSLRQEMTQNREETFQATCQFRGEVSSSLKSVGDSLHKQIMGQIQTMDFVIHKSELKLETLRQTVEKQLQTLTEANHQKLEALRVTVDGNLHAINQQNQKQLEQLREHNQRQLDLIRQTVDEKLQGTLEKRLGESFKQVSERLEQVYRGLGEMQVLANGVGDLKKVLTNVKTRGTWGEVQLGAMLEQVLNPDQFAANVSTKDGKERVEFAIKLPGRGEVDDEIVWLPIDAKFPIEDYQRLLEAQDSGDAIAAENAARKLERQVHAAARDICQKYSNPPKTTDFSILFMPIEGLFAEVIRRNGLIEEIQRRYRVVVAGPTTLWSLLNSLQIGFRTLAIQKRSSEVWNLLAAIKTEWSHFGETLTKVQKKLQEASNSVEAAARKTRVISRKLRSVEELPQERVEHLLLWEESADMDDDREAPPTVQG